jgi:hypothetical protein
MALFPCRGASGRLGAGRPMSGPAAWEASLGRVESLLEPQLARATRRARAAHVRLGGVGENVVIVLCADKGWVLTPTFHRRAAILQIIFEDSTAARRT